MPTNRRAAAVPFDYDWRRRRLT